MHKIYTAKNQPQNSTFCSFMWTCMLNNCHFHYVFLWIRTIWRIFNPLEVTWQTRLNMGGLTFFKSSNKNAKPLNAILPGHNMCAIYNGLQIITHRSYFSIFHAVITTLSDLCIANGKHVSPYAQTVIHEITIIHYMKNEGHFVFWDVTTRRCCCDTTKTIWLTSQIFLWEKGTHAWSI